MLGERNYHLWERKQDGTERSVEELDTCTVGHLNVTWLGIYNRN